MFTTLPAGVSEPTSPRLDSPTWTPIDKDGWNWRHTFGSAVLWGLEDERLSGAPISCVILCHSSVTTVDSVHAKRYFQHSVDRNFSLCDIAKISEPCSVVDLICGLRGVQVTALRGCSSWRRSSCIASAGLPSNPLVKLKFSQSICITKTSTLLAGSARASRLYTRVRYKRGSWSDRRTGSDRMCILITRTI